MTSTQRAQILRELVEEEEATVKELRRQVREHEAVSACLRERLANACAQQEVDAAGEEQHAKQEGSNSQPAEQEDLPVPF
jgi:DNA-binding transcriptional ArsR family regulator